MPSSLHWCDWLVVAVYMAAMVLLGWRAARGNKSLNDYFVGGRNISGFAAGISLVATLLSTASYISYPGESISYGTGFLWQIVALPFVFVVVGYLLIPHIMSFPVSSAYELLESRLGSSIRTLAACLFLLLRLIWMALILHTACSAMSVILEISREWLMIALSIVTIIYTTEGGFRAVIWTDIAQFFVLLFGALFTVMFLMYDEGVGPTWLVQECWHSTLQTPLFSFDPSVRTTAFNWIISVGVFWIATCGSDQVAMQRFFSNRDATVARRTLFVNLLASTVTNITLAAVGLTLLRYYTTHLDLLPTELRDLKASGDDIFPFFVINVMPIGMRGMVVAALLSAAMSSLSSGLNSLTTVLTVDFFRRKDKQQSNAASQGSERRRAQLTTLVVGIFSLALSYPLVFFTQENFITLSSRLMEPLMGPLFGLFALAFFDPRANAIGAWAGFVSGILTGYLIAFGHHIVGDATRLSFLWISPASIFATIVFGMLLPYSVEKHRLSIVTLLRSLVCLRHNLD